MANLADSTGDGEDDTTTTTNTSYLSDDDDGGSSTSGGAELSLPSWLTGNYETLRSFLTDPAQFVLSIVVGFILRLVFTVGDALGAAVQSVATALLTIRDAITAGITAGGGAITGAFAGVEQLFVGVAQSTGPFAPLVLTVIAGAVAFVLLRLFEAAIPLVQETVGSVPVIGGLTAGVIGAFRSLLGGN